MTRFHLALSAVFMGALASSPVAAFHDAGVANCSGCHTMHVSQDGRLGFHWTPGGNPNLLLYGNATDTCVRCHYFRGQISGGNGHGPGGDYYWLTRTYTWTTATGATATSAGHTHGHNVANRVFGIQVDPVNAQAPGGVFRSDMLGCTSCHDPHGNDSFRMLYGSALGPAYGSGTRFSFAANAPLARGNEGTTLVGGGADESDTRHTVYKSGMSAWCANCHPAIHDDATRFAHPAGVGLTSAIADQYNSYVSTDDPAGGEPSSAYNGLVPFEAVAADLDLVDPGFATEGPSGTDQVMCLTCHRAHASPFADAGRWDFAATFLADSHPGSGDGGATAQDLANRYYGYTFTANQRSLCNKCHAKDDLDAPRVP